MANDSKAKSAQSFSPSHLRAFQSSTSTQPAVVASGAIENRRVFLEVAEGEGVPDGATVDSEGFVWVAHMRGGKVGRYDPAGKLEREIVFPVSLTSCPAFGGPDLTTLYVTTASSKFEPADFEREPDAGSLFAVDTNIRGLPEPVYGV